MREIGLIEGEGGKVNIYYVLVELGRSTFLSETGHSAEEAAQSWQLQSDVSSEGRETFHLCFSWFISHFSFH